MGALQFSCACSNRADMGELGLVGRGRVVNVLISKQNSLNGDNCDEDFLRFSPSSFKLTAFRTR
jgi:hypothetical protein